MLQILTLVEGACVDAFDTHRDLHALDVTAVEPVVSNSLSPLWNDNMFTISEVPDAHAADHRLWQRTNLCRVRYSIFAKACFTLGIQINVLEVLAILKCTLADLFQCLRQRY